MFELSVRSDRQFLDRNNPPIFVLQVNRHMGSEMASYIFRERQFFRKLRTASASRNYMDPLAHAVFPAKAAVLRRITLAFGTFALVAIGAFSPNASAYVLEGES